MSFFCFEPIYQDYIWGGDRIPYRFRRTGAPQRCAESWELSDRPEGMSRISGGPLKGKTLRELIHRPFPLLIKLIDANENLSIQVHPDAVAAERFGGEPKTEMWIVLEPGMVYAGFKRPVGRQEFEDAISNDTVVSLLRAISVQPGDVVFIPAGRIHAIGAGCMILEVQQNSNTTYRVYDWGRKSRPLHLEQALECIHFDDDVDPIIQPRILEPGRFELLSTPFFRVERIEGRQVLSAEAPYQIFYDLERGVCSLVLAKERAELETQQICISLT